MSGIQSKSRFQLIAELAGLAIDRFSSIAGIISGVMIVSCALIVFYGVIARYILNQPTLWAMRGTTYLLISFGFLSASFGMKEGAHVRVDIFLFFSFGKD